MSGDARPTVKHPNDQRTSEQSTPSASGPGAGRDLDREERIEREQREEREDILARDDPRRNLTPRRYDETDTTGITRDDDGDVEQ